MDGRALLTLKEVVNTAYVMYEQKDNELWGRSWLNRSKIESIAKLLSVPEEQLALEIINTPMLNHSHILKKTFEVLTICAKVALQFDQQENKYTFIENALEQIQKNTIEMEERYQGKSNQGIIKQIFSFVEDFSEDFYEKFHNFVKMAKDFIEDKLQLQLSKEKDLSVYTPMVESQFIPDSESDPKKPLKSSHEKYSTKYVTEDSDVYSDEERKKCFFKSCYKKEQVQLKKQNEELIGKLNQLQQQNQELAEKLYAAEKQNQELMQANQLFRGQFISRLLIQYKPIARSFSQDNITPNNDLTKNKQ